MQESQPISLSDLKVKFKTAREVMDQRYFPEELLNEFAEYFEWIVDNNPLNTLYLDPELKKFFFDEFVGGIAKRLSLIKELPDIVTFIFHHFMLESSSCEQNSTQLRRNLQTRNRER
jgi:hypothetical protein